jgi:hypothetical protein
VVKLRLGLSSGSTLHTESLAMRSKALSFLSQVLRGGLTQGFAYVGLCRRPWEELPRPLALARPLRSPLLPRGPQQTATRVSEATCECVVRPRQSGHVIAVEQARPLAPADRVQVPRKLHEAGRGLKPPAHRGKIATQWARVLLSPHGTRRHRF